MPDIGTSRPADVYKDLFHLNNGNEGVDSTLRSIQSGNGTDTKVKVSSSQTEIDFAGGKAISPEIKGGRYTYVAQSVGGGGGGEVTASLDFSSANIHKLTLTSTVDNLSIVNAPSTGIVGWLRLIVSRGTFTITAWPSGTIWSGGTPLDLSATTASTQTIVEFTTVDGGSTWYAVTIASSMA